MIAFVLALMLALLTAPPLVTAGPKTQMILETSPLGVTNGGTSILPTSFLGVRFTLPSKTVITGVGGHVKSYDPQEPGFNGDRSLFVAIVPTVDAVSFPDMALSQAVFVHVFDAPFNSVGPYPYQVPETIIDTHLQLDPGEYIILFGSGLFGATGTGWMPIASGNVGTPRYIFASSYTGVWAFHDGDYQPARFVIVGRPMGRDR